ncbi:MAG: glycosyltransferase family 4 protein [Bacteroidetes bacterium]|nr:glycosyltransferase family 4 protein [Bacteroidota bacterium]
MAVKKLAIISTHPIQYNAPLFEKLASEKDIELKVFYTFSQSQHTFKDTEFNQAVDWDIPLLENYNFEFVNNTSKKPSTKRFFGIICPQLISKVLTFNPDFILIYGWSFYSHLRIIKHFNGKIPLWFRGDSVLKPTKSFIRSIVKRNVLKWVYKKIDIAFYVGTKNKEYYKYYGLTESKLRFAPHAIDNDRFSDPKNDAKAAEWKASLGIPPDALTLLFIGKFTANKNPLFIIENFKKLSTENPNLKLKLIMVGEGQLKSQIEKFIGNHPDIILLPFQNQSIIPQVYRLGDLLCMPSYSETWGLAINESLASGTPVLANASIGCASDLIKDGFNGFVFDVNLLGDFEKKFKLIDQKTLQSLKLNTKDSIEEWSFNSIIMAIGKEIKDLNG